MSATGVGYRALYELEQIRPVKVTRRGRRVLRWLVALLWSGAFMFGVFFPYMVVKG